MIHIQAEGTSHDDLKYVYFLVTKQICPKKSKLRI